MLRIIAMLCISLFSCSFANASNDGGEAPPPRKFSVFSMTIDSSANWGGEQYIPNIMKLVEENQPDILSIRGNSERGEELFQCAEHLGYEGTVANIKYQAGVETKKLSILWRKGDLLRNCNSRGVRIGYAPDHARVVFRNDLGRNVLEDYSESSGQLTTDSPTLYFEFPNDVAYRFHSIQLGVESDCWEVAGHIVRKWAEMDRESKPRCRGIFAGDFNATDEQLEELTSSGLLRDATAHMQFSGTSPNTYINRKTLRNLVGCECNDVFYSGHFKAVRTFLMPISPEGIMYRDFKPGFSENGPLGEYLLAPRLPVLAVFELPEDNEADPVWVNLLESSGEEESGEEESGEEESDSSSVVDVSKVEVAHVEHSEEEEESEEEESDPSSSYELVVADLSVIKTNKFEEYGQLIDEINNTIDEGVAKEKK